MKLKSKLVIAIATLVFSVPLFNIIPTNVSAAHETKYYLLAKNGYEKTPNPPKIMKTKIHISGKRHKGIPKALQNKKFASVSDPVTVRNSGRGFLFFKFGKKSYSAGAVQGGSYGGKVFSYVKKDGLYHIKMKSMAATTEAVFKIKNKKLYYLYASGDHTKFLTVYKYQVNNLGF